VMRGLQIQCIRFGLYDTLDQYFRRNDLPGTSLTLKVVGLKTCSALISSFVAGFVSNPWIVLKIRMITDKTGQYRTLGQSIKTIIRNNGYGEFFKGTSLTLVRGSVLSTTELITYDIVKNLVRTKEGFDARACLIASLASSLNGALLSYPLDILRTVHVSDDQSGYMAKRQASQIYSRLKEVVQRRGMKGLYAGFSSYLSRALLYGPLFWNSLELFGYLTDRQFFEGKPQKMLK